MGNTWKKEFIFDPAQTSPVMSHAATLTETEPGVYCAAWFAGSGEGAADTAIWLARRENGHWSAPCRVAKINDEAHWNPVLFRDERNGELSLFFKIGMKIPEWRTWIMRSGDGGRTWSEAVELVPGDRSGGRGPAKNKPICLSNGDWLAPASMEDGLWRAYVDRSSDRGRVWRAEAPLPMNADTLENLRRGAAAGPVANGIARETGVIQPTLWESEPGFVHMLLRSTFGFTCRSDSEDGGHTWSEVRPLDLGNNNSGLDLARFDDGRLLLACNPVAENWGVRTPLTLLISADNGETWHRQVDLEDEPAPPELKPKPEFSYPGIIIGAAGPALVYTWKRKTIVFAANTEEALAKP